MATRLPDARRNVMVDSVVDALDAGAAAGKVEIRTGTQPADADDAASGSLLATLTIGDPAFGVAASGTATANAIAAQAASASGTAGWFRALDSDNTKVMDGSVTATGGGGDMELDSVAITSGQDVTITAWTATQPAG